MEPYSLTTIEVQGDAQSVFEVYSDASREQTVAFVYDEHTARMLAIAPDLLEALRAVLDNLQRTRDSDEPGEFWAIYEDAVVEAARTIARAAAKATQ